jgi:GMP synthase-like glutamine amidotransferase
VRVLAIVHDADAGPGVFAEAIAARGAALDCWEIPAGGPPPRDARAYEAVLALGGAAHPDQQALNPWLGTEVSLLSDLLEAQTPVLGVCLGAELLAAAAGGGARAMQRPEVGWFDVRVTETGVDDPLLGPLAPEFEALGWHSYALALPPGTAALACSEACPQAFRVGAAAWGIQFHAEVTLTDLVAWVDHERSPEEAAAPGVDQDELRARSVEHIERWNELGRRLCGRFLDAALRA